MNTCASVDEAGVLQVAIMPDSYAQYTCLVPTPWMTVIERQDAHDRARHGAWLHGYWIEQERWVRNPLSDRKGQKTTMELTVRPCKTQEEAEFVARKIAAMVERHSGWKPQRAE